MRYKGCHLEQGGKEKERKGRLFSCHVVAALLLSFSINQNI